MIYVIRFKLSFAGSDRTLQHGFTTNTSCHGMTIWPINSDDFKKLQSFIIRVEMTLLDIYESDEIVTDQYLKMNDGAVMAKEIDVPKDEYLWEIQLDSDKKENDDIDEIISDHFMMFGTEFYMKLYPNGKDDADKGNVGFFLYLEKFPEELSAKGIISMRYCVFVKETDTKCVKSVMMTHKKCFASWGNGRISTQMFKKLNSCTIQLVIELVDLYDDGIDISDRFVYLQREDKVKRWLYNDVKLVEYYDRFIEHGIDEMVMVELLTEDALINMGIDNVSHVAQMLIAIADLNLH